MINFMGKKKKKFLKDRLKQTSIKYFFRIITNFQDNYLVSKSETLNPRFLIAFFVVGEFNFSFRFLL